MDKDSDDDLIVGNEDGNRILINDDKGFFKDETSSRLPASGTEETRKVTLADVDGDLDLYFANVAFRPGKQKQSRLLLTTAKEFLLIRRQIDCLLTTSIPRKWLL